MQRKNVANRLKLRSSIELYASSRSATRVKILSRSCEKVKRSLRDIFESFQGLGEAQESTDTVCEHSKSASFEVAD